MNTIETVQARLAGLRIVALTRPRHQVRCAVYDPTAGACDCGATGSALVLLDDIRALLAQMQAAQSPAPVAVQPDMAQPVTLRERIDELVAQHGTLRATARVLMTDCGYLHRLRSGEKTEPGDDLIRRMGLREFSGYVRIAPRKD